MAYLPPKMYVCLEHVLGRYAPFIPSERTGPQTFFSLGVVSEESAVVFSLILDANFRDGTLVGGGHFGVVDDEKLDGAVRADELEA